mmetsp:Transcript_23573/g.54206  ORF Transcript_23573/g.54206 Transcript_23573/m.54206 type:complete len:242 (-) Transcript_23573:3-728(-)
MNCWKATTVSRSIGASHSRNHRWISSLCTGARALIPAHSFLKIVLWYSGSISPGNSITITYSRSASYLCVAPPTATGTTAPRKSVSYALATSSMSVLSVSSPRPLTTARGMRSFLIAAYASSTAAKSIPEDSSVARHGLPSFRNDHERESGLERHIRSAEASSTCDWTAERIEGSPSRRFSGTTSLLAGVSTHWSDCGIVIAAPAQRKCVVDCASFTASIAAHVGSRRGPSNAEKQFLLVQ